MLSLPTAMRASATLFAAFLVGACVTTQDAPQDPADAVENSSGVLDNSLAGTDWELRILVEGTDSLTTLPPDGLHFIDEASISIRSCNSCNGTYRAEDGRLTLENLACTRMACAAGRPELDQLIGDVSTYHTRGDWLIIENGSKRLYFAPGSSLEGN